MMTCDSGAGQTCPRPDAAFRPGGVLLTILPALSKGAYSQASPLDSVPIP
jgi:hypothetical protein